MLGARSVSCSPTITPLCARASVRSSSRKTTCASSPSAVARSRRAIAAGGTYLSSDLCQQAPRPGLEGLSERERDAFLQLAQGATPKQIALDLGISAKTVYLHRETLRNKLGARNDLELHRIAIERGLLP